MKECIKRNGPLIFITILFSFINSGVTSFIAILLQRTIDFVISGDLNGFKRILVWTILYALFIGLIFFVYSLVSKKLIRNVTKALRSKIFNGLLRRNYKDFYFNNTADYISVLTNDTKLIEENLLLPLILIIDSLILFIFTTFILISYSIKITLVLFASILIMLLIPALLGKSLEKKQNELSKQLSSFTTKIKDIFSGFDVIKSYNIQDEITEKYNKENLHLANSKYKADRLLVINGSLSHVLSMAFQFVALFLSGYLVLIGELSAGALVAVIQLSGTLVQPVLTIMSNFPKVSSMKPIIKRIDDFSNYEDLDFTGTATPSFERTLEVSNLSYGYSDNKLVINNINLTIEKNKKYSIVGGSGCGKSTFTKLLLGFYSNFDGDIKYDGTPLDKLDINSLNNLNSIINQNVFMFDKDIKDNILLFKDFSEEEINTALELSGVDKFIKNIPNGLSSYVGENGSNLSGGQRQRIAIARALIRKTPMLVLDEGTSAVDMQTAYDIESKLLQIKDLTLLTITHKMSPELLGLYDEIIFMENGSIIEIGSLETLINAKGKFYDFYTLRT